MTSSLLVTVVEPDLLMECFQMTMTISLFWKVQNFRLKMAAKTMLCKLGAQRFQALAPLSKVEPFGYEAWKRLGEG